MSPILVHWYHVKATCCMTHTRACCDSIECVSLIGHCSVERPQSVLSQVIEVISVGLHVPAILEPVSP